MNQSPSSPPPETYTANGLPILFYAKALYDYTSPIDEPEFNFRAGDIIAVTNAHEDGWWSGELADETREQPVIHIFPSDYLYMVPLHMGTYTGNAVAGTGTERSPIHCEAQSTPQNQMYTEDGQPILLYVKALYDYIATIDEEFDFKEGDVIAVTDTAEHGRWQGELVDDVRRQPGQYMFQCDFVSAPSRKLPAPVYPPMKEYTDDGRLILFYVRALYDYTATIDEELDFKAGDIIAVTDMLEGGWWTGELLDETLRETGRDVFPSNFVGLLP